MIRLWILGIALCAAHGSALGQARFLTERVEGTKRICAYERTVTPAGEEPVITRAVGLAEPCPLSPHAEMADPTASEIPLMARLHVQGTTDRARICVYRYLGREYRKWLALTESCPVTPHFFGQQEVTSGLDAPEQDAGL